jgi:dipeptidase D
MSNEILNLKPEKMWKYFHEITQVPRPSKKEEKIRQYLVDFGKRMNLETIVDEIGNVLIRKPASKGYEDRKTVVLQSHMDMVCEKNSDVEFNFDKDAIQTRIEGDWLKATGTTLGADDGIGIAAAMAILDDDNLEHPAIEALFTMDEETGLTGAFGLSTDLLKGKILLNLDSEDEGEVFIGCAGGRDTIIELDYQPQWYGDGNSFFRIDILGLNGGHSGDDIHKGYANANKLLNRILWQARKEIAIDLAIFDGGNLRNAIAREAYAIVMVPKHDSSKLSELVSNFETIFKNEYHITEPKLAVKINEHKEKIDIIDKDSFEKLCNSLYSCPHGVIAWSQDIDNFVETSTNLASVKFNDGKIIITTSQRSSVASALDNICNMVAANFASVGASIKHTDGYPGWTPNPNSEILEVAKESYVSLFKKEPKVLAIHAGLECGLIGEKYPEMDMISFGPTIKGAHSPDERILIDTASMFWDYLIDILKRTPKI